MASHINYNPGFKIPESERKNEPLNMADFVQVRYADGVVLFPKVKHGN